MISRTGKSAAQARRRPPRTRFWQRFRPWANDFALPAPEISGAAYQQRLHRLCAEALARGAADLATGDLFDRTVDADLQTDLRRIDEESSRCTTVVARAEAHRARRRERAEQRTSDLDIALAAEETKLADLDGELNNRRQQQLLPATNPKPRPVRGRTS